MRPNPHRADSRVWLCSFPDVDGSHYSGAGPAQILAICDDIRARPALARSLSTVGPPRAIRFRRSSEAKAPGSRGAAASMAGRPPAAPLVGAGLASGSRRTTPRLCQNPRVSTPVCLDPARHAVAICCRLLRLASCALRRICRRHCCIRENFSSWEKNA